MEETTLGRIPPHSQEAEVSILGAMLLFPSATTIALEILNKEDFYFEAHRLIYDVITSLYSKNIPVDIITVGAELEKRGQLAEAGGNSYLAHLSGSAGAASNSEAHCNIVKEKSTLRDLIEAGEEIVADSYSDKENVSVIIEKAEKSIFDITQGNQKSGLLPVKDALLETFNMMEERATNPEALTGLSTGFIDIDNKLSGLQKSDLLLLAARPSMGKTALMVNIATNAALKAGASVAVFSLEMSREQLARRMISSIAQVDLAKITSGKLNDQEWVDVIEAVGHLSDINLTIDDTPAISPLEVKAKCRRLMAEKGLDLIVIDYLQLMETNARTESRQQEISAISRSLKAIAKELNVPLLALSQLSRAPELRSDHRPILSDLRESGAIEQDADVVMFLYRDEYYNPDTEKRNQGELIVAKHRNGPTGTIELLFKGEYTKFLNFSYYE